MKSNCLPNLYLFTGKHLNFPSMGCLPKKEASSDYNEAKNMLYVLHVSYSYITECIHPIQNALLESLTLSISMTSGETSYFRDVVV